LEGHKIVVFVVASLEFVWKDTQKQGKHVFQDSPSSSSKIRKMYLSKVFVFCVDTPCVLGDMHRTLRGNFYFCRYGNETNKYTYM